MPRAVPPRSSTQASQYPHQHPTRPGGRLEPWPSNYPVFGCDWWMVNMFQMGFWYMPDKIFPNPSWERFGRGHMWGPVPSRQDGCDCIRLAPSALSSNLSWDLHPQMPPHVSTTLQLLQTNHHPPTSGKKCGWQNHHTFLGALSWKNPTFQSIILMAQGPKMRCWGDAGQALC